MRRVCLVIAGFLVVVFSLTSCGRSGGLQHGILEASSGQAAVLSATEQRVYLAQIDP